MQGINDANNNADDLKILGAVNRDWLVCRILGAQLRHRVSHQPFDGEFPGKVRNDNIVVLRLYAEIHQQKRAVEDTDVFHGVAGYPQDISG